MRLWQPMLQRGKHESPQMTPDAVRHPRAAARRRVHHRARGERRHRQDLHGRGAGGPLRRRGRRHPRPDAGDHLRPGRQPGAPRAGPRPAGRRRAGPRRPRPRSTRPTCCSPTWSSDDVPQRRKRITDALAGFDGATIATTHQFCQLVLRSLGVAGDTDSRAELVESLDDLVVEVTDDLYLQRFGSTPDEPPFESRGRAPAGPGRGRGPPGRAGAARRRAGHRRRRPRGLRVRRPAPRSSAASTCRGVLSYDDLLSRLADALEADDAPARQRMRQRWEVVLVDEFQDTDPVQWEVLDRAFSGAAPRWS